MEKYLNKILQGDCLERMKELPDNSVDLICTDPPYGIGFMGKEWDTFRPDMITNGIKKSSRKKSYLNPKRSADSRKGASPAMESARYDHSPSGAKKFREWFTEISSEMLRVLKPGAFAFVCIGARQDSVSACITAMTEAGFKTDFTSLFWTYSSGFPKASNIGKMIDKRQGAIRQGAWSENHFAKPVQYETGEPITNDAKRFEGSYGGFQPKPAIEVIVVAMKTLSEKTFVDQALKNGKGITWMDKCRIPTTSALGRKGGWNKKGYVYSAEYGESKSNKFFNSGDEKGGRFPANFLVSDNIMGTESKYFSLDAWYKTLPFLHVAKPAKSEKDNQLESNEKVISDGRDLNKIKDYQTAYSAHRAPSKNTHPTVKPLKLMSYLIMLGSREGDIIFDPFSGSGTTLVAAKQLDRRYIGIEREKEYIGIAEARLKDIQLRLFTAETNKSVTGKP